MKHPARVKWAFSWSSAKQMSRNEELRRNRKHFLKVNHSSRQRCDNTSA
uniref:Uncharacterized protein n=1 Tax=Anguilla anguilla TaxID=7936 RepID=A0A0E9WUY8_ANGAN